MDETVGLEAVLMDKDFIAGVDNYLRGLREMNSATDKASGEINRSGAQISAGMAAMMGAIAGAAAAGTMAVIRAVSSMIGEFAKLARAIGDFVVMGIQTNASLEQLQIRLETVTGAGEEMLAWVKDVSKATPFTGQQLATVIAMAAAYGFSNEEAKALAMTVGDTAAAMGTGDEGMNSVIRTLGQIQSRTKVAASEMLQLTEQGIPAWQMLADGMGVTVAELQDMVSKGLVPAEQAIPILTEAMNDKFGGAMKEQSLTAKGLFDTLKETFELMAAEITTPVFDTMKEVLLGVTDLLNSPEFQTGFEDVKTSVIDFVEALVGAFDTLSQGAFATELLPAIGEAMKALFGVGKAPDFDWIGTLADGINELATPLSQIITMLAGGDILGALGILTGGDKDAGQFFAGIATAITFAQDAIGAFVTSIQTTLGPTFTRIFDQLTGILADFGLNWGDIWEAVKTALGVVAVVIGGILAGLLGVIVGIVSGIASAIEQIVIAWRAILPHIAGAVEGIIKIVAGLWGFFDNLFRGDFPAAFEGLKVAWDGLWQTFGEIISAAWEGIKGTFNLITGFIEGFVDGITSFFTDLYNNLVGHSIVTDLVDGVLGQFTALKDIGSELFTAFTDGIFQTASTLADNIIGKFSEIAGGVAGALSGAGGGAAPGAPAPTGGGGGAPNSEQLTAMREQIAAIRTDFDALMLSISTGMTLLITTLAINMTAMLEATVMPFVSGIQQISNWITVGIAQFDAMTMAVTKMRMAFAAFGSEGAMSIILMFAGVKAQFDAFGLYLEENKGNWAKSWLDFVVAMEVDTTTAVNYIIGEFYRLANNVGGQSTALTTSFEGAMDTITQKLNTTVTDSLVAAGGAFGALADAAKAAANDVAENTASICDSVTAAYECVTGSPELIIQHPFEGFSEFLKKATPQVQSMIGEMVSPMDELSAQALNMGTNLSNTLGRVNARAQTFGAGGGTTSVVNNNEYNLGPVYQQPQAPASMIDDLALMNLLATGG